MVSQWAKYRVRGISLILSYYNMPNTTELKKVALAIEANILEAKSRILCLLRTLICNDITKNL